MVPARLQIVSTAVVAIVAALLTVAPAAHAVPPKPSKLLIVMLENTSGSHAIDGMPRLAAAARTYGYATDYSAITHPSLPNYLAIAGGSTFSVRDDASPGSHPVNGPSIFGQALAHGKTAKTYAESMPSNCDVNPAAPYAVKHNPWAYFADATERSACRKYDVPSGTTRSGVLRTDVLKGALPTIGMLIPNLCHDAHDCSLTIANKWLSPWLKTIENGPDWRSGRLTVVVTFDEDDYSEGNHVLTVVLSPDVRHQRCAEPLTHFSLTRYADELSGAAPLRSAGRATSLSAGFQALKG